jgi:hypothetical protein
MKKITILLLLVVSLALAACGSSSTTDQSTSGTTTGASSGTATGTDTAATQPGMSTALELIVGTFKLEGTENAVTADEAKTLIPLWQAYASLSQSDTTAQAELDALIQQIKDTMGTKQTDAIAALKLTQQDAFAFMQENGITMGGGNAANASGTPMPGQDMSGFTPGQGGGGGTTTGGGSAPSGGMPSGGGPGGNMPSGGGSAPQGGSAPSDLGASGQTLDPQAAATAQAGRGAGRNMNVAPAALVNALIELLQSK